MIELSQLEQLAAFAEYGTLSLAAEKLHMSQPTLTRSMQKLEAAFGVPLFLRTKNRLALNENGRLAADYARRLLGQAQDMLQLVRAFDRASHTLSIGSCAPMPMLSMVQAAARLFPDMAVASEMKGCAALLDGLRDGSYQAAILPCPPEGAAFFYREYGRESLSFALPPTHRLARREGLSMQELDGESLLLYAEIGFWHDMAVRNMPHSRFLVQGERSALDELIQSSSLPAFVSDVVIRLEGAPPGRVVVPILDAEAHATYYAACLRENLPALRRLMESPFP